MAFSPARVALAALAGIAVLGAAGCGATVNKRGYLPDPGKSQAIRVGVDTKSSLEANLGSPSTTSTFSDNRWYYISSTQKDELFFRPQETDRQIMVVSFGPDERVTGVEYVGLDQARQIAFSDAETPARGRELTFLQQIFGNVGRGSPIGGLNDPNNDPRERR